MSKKMGRPSKFTEEKIRQLKAICRVKPTLEDCAAILDISARSIERFIRKEYDQTFVEFREQNMAWTRHMIVREILEQCKKGNMTALIFASKNLCGWSDNPAGLDIQKTEIKIHLPDEKAKDL